MARWTVETPMTHTLDGIVALKVRIVGGQVNIIPTDDPVTFEITDVEGEPLEVVQEAGILSIHYRDLTGQGFLDRLKPLQLTGYKSVHSRRATVNLRLPRECPVEITTATAPVVAAGLSARTRIRTANGSASVRAPGGTLNFNSASGRLAVAGGRLSELRAKTLSGHVLVDTDLASSARVRVNTVSGEVALRVPAESSANVDLRTMTGGVDSDFGLDRDSATARTTLKGKIGVGADPASITVNTVSGRTALLRRAPEAPAAIPEGA